MKLKNILIVIVAILVFLATLKSARFFSLPNWLTNLWAFHAITLPPIGIFLASSANTESTVNHELVHWEQWKRYGTIKFYLKYLYLSYKHGYQNNPMEIEARNEA